MLNLLLKRGNQSGDWLPFSKGWKVVLYGLTKRPRAFSTWLPRSMEGFLSAPNLSRNQSGHFYSVPPKGVVSQWQCAGRRCKEYSPCQHPAFAESWAGEGKEKAFSHGTTETSWIGGLSGSWVRLTWLVSSLPDAEGTERNGATSLPGRIRTQCRAQHFASNVMTNWTCVRIPAFAFPLEVLHRLQRDL